MIQKVIPGEPRYRRTRRVVCDVCGNDHERMGGISQKQFIHYLRNNNWAISRNRASCPKCRTGRRLLL